MHVPLLLVLHRLIYSCRQVALNALSRIVLGIAIVVCSHCIAIFIFATLSNFRCRNRESNFIIDTGRNVFDFVTIPVGDMLYLPLLVASRIFANFTNSKRTVSTVVFFHCRFSAGSNLHRTQLFGSLNIGCTILRFFDLEVGHLGDTPFFIAFNSICVEFAVVSNLDTFNMGIVVKASGIAQLVLHQLSVSVSVIGIVFQCALFYFRLTFCASLTTKHLFSFTSIGITAVIGVSISQRQNFAAAYTLLEVLNRVEVICVAEFFTGIHRVSADTGYMSCNGGNVTEYTFNAPH